MTNQEYIEQLAKYVIKYANQYGIKVHSPIIAQGICESGYGQSKLSAQYNNHFGLKCGTLWHGASVNMKTQEEYTQGTYTTISDNFRAYSSFEEGVKGYFEFIQLARYQNLRGITDPYQYLETIRADGYATSYSYVQTCSSLIKQWNLTKYDGITSTESSPTSTNSSPTSTSTTKITTSKYDKYINSKGTHWISNSGGDENGGAHGGQAGDQTGGEWRMREWYDRKNWDCILRYPDIKVGIKIAELGCAAALNDKIGYDQYQRETYWSHLKANGFDPSKISIACESDCSAGVIANTAAAGYILGIPALQNIKNTATYTGDMKQAFRAAGFEVLTGSKYTSGYSYLRPGDILLNEVHHTATNVTNGANSGITIGSDSYTQSSYTGTSYTETRDWLQNGDIGDEVKTLQKNLVKVGYSLDVDGEYGDITESAVRDFQIRYGLTVDGEAGKETISKLKEIIQLNTQHNSSSTTTVYNESSQPQQSTQNPIIKEESDDVKEFKKFDGVITTNNTPLYKYSKGIEPVFFPENIDAMTLVDVVAEEEDRYEILVFGIRGYVKKSRVAKIRKPITDQSEFPFTGQSIVNELNVKKKPGSKYKNADYPYLDKGDVFQVTKQKTGSDGNIYYYIQFSDGGTVYHGWVRANFVKKRS